MINPLEGFVKVGSIFYIEEKKKYWLCTCIEKDEKCIVYKGVLEIVHVTNKDSYPEFVVTRKINGKEGNIRFRIGRKLYEFNITNDCSDDNKLASIFSNPVEPLNLYEFEQLVNTIFISIV